ncbi:Protein CBR-CLEC-1 [Caenorhabditis briggsae]|uniref:C-type lectin domain-containing protein n=2 Tax=Caenorhabditis briggsae TaxID=6238 RepID=A0AAE9JM44_CAEBR|nr:Protein CBR-CLEC-1 [Caenorhabditis briggsae]ULT90025.1 hypothetical protein L3Y34_008424 [Caenorhabditis briggsae]UMM35824.1 hypothetical protein L5515_008273 [Caenorhabditis briggsae]CAP29231.1 Protein CBR-CLEC-1 [Caenorhabditis briggsae]
MVFTVIALVVSAILIPEALADPCGDSNWRYFPQTNSCYKLIDENLPWTIAEFKCLFQGAHHVSIDSPEENQFVHELSHWSEIWTGAAFFGKDMHYVNSDGSRYGNFENWKDGRKPPMNRARRCIKMDQNGEWFQSCCKKKTYTICEKKAAYSASSYSGSNNSVNGFRFMRHRS